MNTQNRDVHKSHIRVGDYKMFFQDPRTRDHYLQWAYLMLLAEDYHSGKLKPQLPLNAPKIKFKPKP